MYLKKEAFHESAIFLGLNESSSSFFLLVVRGWHLDADLVVCTQDRLQLG